MSISSAGVPSRWLRMGLSAGAASFAAVALSLLLSGSAASASEDQDLGGGVAQLLGSTVGGVIETATDPLDASDDGLGAALAPVEQTLQPVSGPIVEQLAPIVQPVLQAPPVAAGTVRDVAVPMIGELAPVLQPLAPVVDPVLAPVDRLVDDALHDVVAPVVTPVAGTVDDAVGMLPIVDGLLGEAPAAGPIEPVIGIDPVDLIQPVPAAPGIVPPGPPPAFGGEPDSPPTVADASALVDASVAIRSTEARAVDLGAARAEVTSTAVRIAAVGEPRGGGRALVPAVPPLDGAVPSGASGSAGAHASPPAIVQDHPLPALAVGRVDALEHDRVPSSLAEEHTASPD